jgi:hypothetical protein
MYNHRVELERWIQTVLEGRPQHEQNDAKAELSAWINANVRKQDRRKYQDFCVAELVTALDERKEDERA